MRSLTATTSEAELFAWVIAFGLERGLQITPAELKQVAQANRREWLERWLPL